MGMGFALFMARMVCDGGVYRPDLCRGFCVGWRAIRTLVLDRLCRSPDRRPDRRLCIQGRKTTVAMGRGVKGGSLLPYLPRKYGDSQSQVENGVP